MLPSPSTWTENHILTDLPLLQQYQPVHNSKESLESLIFVCLLLVLFSCHPWIFWWLFITVRTNRKFVKLALRQTLCLPCTNLPRILRSTLIVGQLYSLRGHPSLWLSHTATCHICIPLLRSKHTVLLHSFVQWFHLYLFPLSVLWGHSLSVHCCLPGLSL